MRLMRLKTFAGLSAGLALCLSPTMATAAISTPIQSINPLVAVGIYGTSASAAVLAQAEVPGGGPVLPQVDVPPPPPPPSEAPPPPPPPPSSGGFGISPVILGLLGIAGLALLIASSNDNGNSPSSPG